MHLFHHNDGIGSFRQHIPGINHITAAFAKRLLLGKQGQRYRRRFLRAKGVRRPHGNAIHRGAVIMRYRLRSVYRNRRHSPQGLV